MLRPDCSRMTAHSVVIRTFSPVVGWASYVPAGYHRGITLGIYTANLPFLGVQVAPKLKHLDRTEPNRTDPIHVRFPLALPIPQTLTSNRVSRGITRKPPVYLRLRPWEPRLRSTSNRSSDSESAKRRDWTYFGRLRHERTRSFEMRKCADQADRVGSS
jgi:hypothetical protein